MARMFGQEVDQALVESIEREEKLAAALFSESKKEPEITGYKTGTTFLNRIPILKEDLLTEAEPPPPPAPAFVPPIASNTVTQTMNLLNTAAPNIMTTLERAELEGVKKTLADLMKKIGTLSWGGGGTGIVRVFDADDFDRTSAQNGRYMRWDNGVFSLDEINPFEIIHNTTLVTTPTYVVQDEDYYIGVNRAGPVTIIIPSEPTSGREIAIKDESGNCETHNITISGPIDNDANGAILAINNGALHMLFRGDYWRII